MAALGFSVLMREWRRGMAFDPWHGSLYLSLSAVITLSRLWIWRNKPAPLDSISSVRPTLTLSAPAAAFAISSHQLALIDSDWSPQQKKIKKTRQKQICENIILFAELCFEQASRVVMLQFHIMSLSKTIQEPRGSARKSCNERRQAKHNKPPRHIYFLPYLETFKLQLLDWEIVEKQGKSLCWRARGLLTVVDLAWKMLFIAALMALPNQAWLGRLNK